jgi:hypothetical protein
MELNSGFVGIHMGKNGEKKVFLGLEGALMTME